MLCQDKTLLADCQLQQTLVLVDEWHRTTTELAEEGRQLSAAIQSASTPGGSCMNASEIFDQIELLLSSTALALEADLCLIVRFRHSVLTPLQAASFIAAAWPHAPDWVAIACSLAAQSQHDR